MIKRLILALVFLAGECLSLQPVKGTSVEEKFGPATPEEELGWPFQLINDCGLPIAHVYLIPDTRNQQKWKWRKDYTLPKGPIADKESRIIGFDQDDSDVDDWFLRIVFSDGTKVQFDRRLEDIHRTRSLTLTRFRPPFAGVFDGRITMKEYRESLYRGPLLDVWVIQQRDWEEKIEYDSGKSEDFHPAAGAAVLSPDEVWPDLDFSQ